MNLTSRVEKLERGHAGRLTAASGFDLEWWRWRRATRRGEVYDPKLEGVSFSDWQAAHLAQEARPEGLAWLALRADRLARVEEVGL